MIAGTISAPRADVEQLLELLQLYPSLGVGVALSRASRQNPQVPRRGTRALSTLRSVRDGSEALPRQNRGGHRRVRHKWEPRWVLQAAGRKSAKMRSHRAANDPEAPTLRSSIVRDRDVAS